MNQKFPIVSATMAVIGIIVIVYIFVSKDTNDTLIDKTFVETIEPQIVNTEQSPSPSPTPVAVEQDEIITQKPSPRPTPPILDDSDSHIITSLKDIENGKELAQMLTKEEIARKVVRAIYGLSEGRIVRQYRPILSPEKNIIVNKIGQQTVDTQEEIYRISRENGSRYTHYISIFSKLNNSFMLELYKFYLPTLEQAYQELGTNKDDFHSTLIKAVDMLLNSPSSDQAILLTQPTVMYKFIDPELEKLPQAHKLMLRMGQENSEALKLELKKLRANLLFENS